MSEHPIDSEHRDYPTCPRCGRMLCDPVDLPQSLDTGILECDHCGGTCAWRRDVTITYTTTTAQPHQAEQPYAMATRDGYQVPLIGIPASAGIEHLPELHNLGNDLEEWMEIRVRKDLVPAGATLVEAYLSDGEIVVMGQPKTDDDHNCDAMGCGTLSHVLHRFPLPGGNKPDNLFYGVQDQERLDRSLPEAIATLLFNCNSDDIRWPVKIFEHRQVDVTRFAKRLAQQALEDMLVNLDEEYSDPDGDYTKPTPAMQAAALTFAQAVTGEYVSWACVPTGRVIEVTREEALGEDPTP